MKKKTSLGVMIDMSRNAVMSLEGLEKYMPLLHKMGYDKLFLYTEDTYEVEGEPYFGYMRGRYSLEELKRIDEIGEKNGIEVVPCIQTLAHLNIYETWHKHPFDGDGVLLVDDDRTYELIEKMFATLSKCFKSRLIHVGMDEAMHLGRGRHLDVYGHESVDSIMRRHLGRVMEIGEKYGYKIMIWSDMFFRGWNNNEYYCPAVTMPKEYVDAFPNGLIPVYWDYYQKDSDKYRDMLHNHLQLSRDTWFAGGAWTWGGYGPHNYFSIDASRAAIDACRDYGVTNIMFTMWGDLGGECSRFAVLPCLYYSAQYAKGVTDTERIKKGFKRLTGMEFDDFLLLDEPNNVSGRMREFELPTNPSRFMVTSDTFNGYYDYCVQNGGCEHYRATAEKLRGAAKMSRRYGYLFDVQAKLCIYLADKYELGVKTRKAYRDGDKDTLKALADGEYARCIKSLKVFLSAHREQWVKENKTYGYQTIELRLGGTLERLSSNRKRLLDYCSGKIDRIEELECEILPMNYKPDEAYFNHPSYVFVSVPV